MAILTAIIRAANAKKLDCSLMSAHRAQHARSQFSQDLAVADLVEVTVVSFEHEVQNHKISGHEHCYAAD
jgi:hypothetical protein